MIEKILIILIFLIGVLSGVLINLILAVTIYYKRITSIKEWWERNEKTIKEKGKRGPKNNE